MTRPSIAVVGANGYVGRALCRAIEKQGDSKLVKVTRENYSAMQNTSYDVLINAAMPSGRFWAKKNPDADYEETVQKTANLLKNWRTKKFVQISTVSARVERDSVYGAHKAEAEKLCDLTKHLVIRLSATYGPTLAKGALIDILNGARVFVSGESRYPFAPLSFVADWIAQNLHRTGLFEIGAENTVSLKEVADHLGQAIIFEGPIENQEILKPEPGFPDAKGVFEFIDSMRKAKHDS